MGERLNETVEGRPLPPSSRDLLGSSEAKTKMIGRTSRRKRGLGRKIADSFFMEDAYSVGDYVVEDVLVPSLKNLIFSIISNTAEMCLFGGKGSGLRTENSKDPYTPYNKFPKVSYIGDRSGWRNNVARGKQDRGFIEYVFDNRRDAEMILDDLLDKLHRYRGVSVAYYYGEIGEPYSHVDEKYGWEELDRDVRVIPVRGGYIINLPKPKPLD